MSAAAACKITEIAAGKHRIRRSFPSITQDVVNIGTWTLLNTLRTLLSFALTGSGCETDEGETDSIRPCLLHNLPSDTAMSGRSWRAAVNAWRSKRQPGRRGL